MRKSRRDRQGEVGERWEKEKGGISEEAKDRGRGEVVNWGEDGDREGRGEG